MSKVVRLLIILTAITMAVLTKSVQSSNTVNKHIIKAYDKVSHFLDHKAVGKDDKYLRIVKYSLLGKLEEEKKKSFVTRSRHLIDALEKIISLANLADDDKCSNKSLELLEFNDEATEGNARINWNPETARPIDKLLHYYFEEHAEYCEKIYPAQFKKHYANVDEKVIGDIDPLLVDVMAERLESEKKFFFDKKDPNYLYEVIVKPKNLTPGEYDIILDELSRRMKSEQITKNPETDVFSLLREPCEKYMDALKPNLFGPAAFDQVLSKPMPSGRKEIEYFHTLAKYNTCAFMDTNTFKVDLLERFSHKIRRHQPSD